MNMRIFISSFFACPLKSSMSSRSSSVRYARVSCWAIVRQRTTARAQTGDCASGFNALSWTQGRNTRNRCSQTVQGSVLTQTQR